MSITTKQKEVLNTLADYIPAMRKGQLGPSDGGDIMLGTLIADAESVSPTEITLASGKVLIGASTGLAAAQTLSGDVSVTTGGVATVPNASVIGKVLTGFVSGAGTVAATDTILQAVNKLDGNVAAALPAAKLVSYLSAATAGGSGITETLAVTGLAAGDTILAVTPEVVGAAPTAALTAHGAPGAASLSVTYTIDPGAGAKVRVLVLKA